MPRLLILVLLFSVTAQASYEFEREAITECWKEGEIIDFTNFDEVDEPPFFTPKQCNNLESDGIQRNFFAAYGAPEMEKINDLMQEKLEPLWRDNAGHSQALIKENFNLLRTYNTCLDSLCDLIARDCGTLNQVGDWEKNFDRCTLRKNELIQVHKAQTSISLEGNTARKKRSLMVEKMSAISFRMDKFMHGQLSAFNRNIAIAEQAILALTRQTW